MTDLIAIGASGVRAYQTALGVVGDNVANADTPGYVRRTVVLRPGGGAGAGDPLSRGTLAGSGVAAGGIARAYDALKTAAARNADADLARLTTRTEWLASLQTVLSSGVSSLNGQIGGFFNAAQDLAADPASTAARTIFLDRADQTAGAFRSTGGALANLAADLAAATAAQTAQVNDLTAGLARVNTQLRRTQPGGAAANGLLDSRDTLLADLSKLLRVTATEGVGGTVEVRLGEGGNTALLVGLALAQSGGARRVGVGDGPAGPVLVLDPTHAAQSVRLPASGSLAGLLEASRRTGEATAAIDALATRFGDAVNAQHAAGTDATGAAGTPLFATRDLAVTAGRANAGQAVLGVDIADLGTVDASGYRMDFIGGVWTLARGDGSASISGPGPLMLDGVTVTPSGAPGEGDGYALTVADGAKGMRLRPLDPANVAAADRWLGDAAGSNLGTGRLALRFDAAAAGLPLLPEYRLTVTAAGADITDPATAMVLASVAAGGGWLAGAGFDFALSGTPAIGDAFRISATGAASSDNGNLRALLAVRDAAGTGGTIEASLDGLSAGLASNLSETRRLGEAAAAVAADAARAADGVSGVDLDREAAELTRLQAAYKANAQVIAAARDLFDVLLRSAG